MINTAIILFISIFIINFLVEIYLENINNSHIEKNRDEPPKIFRDIIDIETYKKSVAYSLEKNRFSLISSIFDFFLFLIVIYSGLFNSVDVFIRKSGFTELHSGVIFFMVLLLASTFKSIPFTLYSNFVIEEKYGFNTQTVKLWIVDFFKGLAISLVLSLIVSYGLLSFMLYAGNYWWLLTWLFVFGIGLIMMKVFPLWIAPLFNKFEEIKEGKLRSKIDELGRKANFPIKNIFRIDAGKRSKHSNAYFTGSGKSKRVVLYDTLIEGMTTDEITAVLAHEIGHYKFKHILKGILITQVISLFFFFVLSLCMNEPILYKMFLVENQSVYMGIILLGILWSIISFWVTPLFTLFSRRNEFQADAYALKLIKDKKIFISLFKKLSIENLSNLTPHPVYSKFYYSHPPVVERIAKL